MGCCSKDISPAFKHAHITGHKHNFEQHDPGECRTFLNCLQTSFSDAAIEGRWDSSEIPRDGGLSGVVLLELN